MKTILFSILILFSVNGFSFNWKKVSVDSVGDLYVDVDVDSIKKHNGLIYYWLLVDLLEPFQSGTNSYIDKFKVDCREEKQTQLNFTAYSQSMGKGRILFEDTPNEILYPKPKEVRYIVMKFVCDYAK